MLEPLPYLAAAGVAAAAVYTDSKDGLIPNRITIPAALAGLALNTLAAGWGGFAFGLQGLGLGFGLLLLPCLLGRTGGGDLKLLAAFGACLGPSSVLTIFVYAALLGGALALFLAARRLLPLLVALHSRGDGPAEPLWPAAKAVGPFPFAASLLAGLVLLTTFKGG